MLRIAICDDDREFCNQIRTYLFHYSLHSEFDIDVKIFTTGEELIKDMESTGAFELIFLDIEFETMNGVEIGRQIRNFSLQDITQIVYVSSKESYAMQLFKVRPMDFLIKPVTKQDISRIMNLYARLYMNTLYFEIKVGKQKIHIRANEILYFQCEGRKIKIKKRTTDVDDKVEFYGSMSDVKKMIQSESFIEIHKSYIINLQYVLQFCGNEVVMSDGKKLPISQSYRKQVNNILLEYFEKMG